jgi:hypothetical protein
MTAISIFISSFSLFLIFPGILNKENVYQNHVILTQAVIILKVDMTAGKMRDLTAYWPGS